MDTEQVAQKVVELTRKQAWKEALESLYAKDIVSVESRPNESGSPETRGIDGVRGKVDWWLDAMETHSVKVYGPFVAHDRFVVQYDMDVTDKSSKKLAFCERGTWQKLVASKRRRVLNDCPTYQHEKLFETRRPCRSSPLVRFHPGAPCDRGG